MRLAPTIVARSVITLSASSVGLHVSAWVHTEDKIVIKAQLKQLELQCPGFSQFLGNHSMVDPKLKAMIKTMDSQ